MSDRDVWRQVVARGDARIDQGVTLAGTELEHALRRWPDGYEGERELPIVWLHARAGSVDQVAQATAVGRALRRLPAADRPRVAA